MGTPERSEVGSDRLLADTPTLLRAVIDSVLDPHVWLVAVRDDSGRIIDFQYVEANRAACVYTGLDHEDLMGAFFLDVSPWHRDSGLFDTFADVVDNGVPAVLQDWAHHRDPDEDSVRRFDVRAVPVGNGLSCSWRDVTEHSRQARALAESEERYRLLTEHSADAVGMFRPDGFCEWGTPRMMLDYGLDPAAAPGTLPWDYLHDDDRPTAVARLFHVAMTGEVLTPIEVRLRQPDSTFRWVAISAERVGGEGSNIVVAVRDVDEQVRAREELARSEEHYHLLADHASDVVYMTDANGAMKWLSPTSERTLGWTSQDLLGTEFIQLLHPDDQPTARRMRDVISVRDTTGLSESNLVARVRTKRGDYRWFSGTANRYTDSEGNFAGIVMGLKDVSELVAARESMTRERDRVQATLDSLLDPHVVVEAERDALGEVRDFVLVSANDAACTFLRRTRTGLLFRRISDFMPTAQRRPVELWFRRAIQYGAPIILDDVEYPAPLFGRVRRLDVRGVRVGDAVSFTWRDVTDRHEAARALADSEQRYRHLNAELEDLLTNGSVLALRVDRDGRLVWVSGSAPRLLGYAVADLVGTNVSDWLHPDDVGTGLDAGQLFAVGADAGLVRFRMRAADGGYRTLEGRAFQAAEANGEQIVQGTMTDVTERELAERLRSQLLAVASHELRSPLAFIHASLRLLSTGTVTPDSDTGKDLLARVTATSERLARIADTLLRLQNLELADQPVPTEPVVVGKVVSDAARSTPTERDVEVVCSDHTDGTLRLRVDADQLTQAVINLTTNAVKHAPDGTRVEVFVSAAPLGMRVEVRDHGPGVPPEHRQAVFQAFHQLQWRDKSAGVGLGLAIVAKIVERHGGRVWVEQPDDGAGARFVFEIGEALAVGHHGQAVAES